MAWNKAKPADNSALVSAEIRANWDALDAALVAPLTALANGQVLVKAAGPVLAGVAGGTDGLVLTLVGGVPTWAAGVTGIGRTVVVGANPATTAEVVLQSVTIPANLLGPAGGARIEIRATGTLGATGNNKVVRLRLNGLAGGAVVFTGTVTTNIAEWLMVASVAVVGANLVNAEGSCVIGAAGGTAAPVSVHTFNALNGHALPLTSPWTVDVTGQSTTTGAAGDVTALGLWVTFFP